METRIAVTPSEDTVVNARVLHQCYPGLVYFLDTHNRVDRRSVFEIRGNPPTVAAVLTLLRQLKSRVKIFEIFQVEVEYPVKAKVEDVDEFEDEAEEVVSPDMTNEDIAEVEVVAMA